MMMNTTTTTQQVKATCTKCGGAGFLAAFAHICGGECFTCGGAGYTVMSRARFDASPYHHTLFVERSSGATTTATPATEAQIVQLMRAACTFDSLGMTIRAYLDEWTSVVVKSGITTEREYVRANRSGRPMPLGRKDRRAAWAVFAAMARLMKERELCL